MGTGTRSSFGLPKNKNLDFTLYVQAYFSKNVYKMDVQIVIIIEIIAELCVFFVFKSNKCKESSFVFLYIFIKKI